MRRLELAPDLKEMEVTDIENGRFVFPPLPDKPVSLEKLRQVVVDAGYEIEGTRIEVTGTLTPDGKLRVAETGQVFRLGGEEIQGQAADAPVSVAGVWKVQDQEEIIVVEAPRTQETPHP